MNPSANAFLRRQSSDRFYENRFWFSTHPWNSLRLDGNERSAVAHFCAARRIDVFWARQWTGILLSSQRRTRKWHAVVSLHGRTGNLEVDLCKHLALDFEQGAEEDAERAWQTVKAFIDQDIPVLLHLELSRLPYYDTRTPFPGHRALVVGYDDERHIAFLADTHFPGFQKVTYDILRTARDVHFPPLTTHNQWLVIKPARQLMPLSDAIVNALRDNAREMIQFRSSSQGIAGMKFLAVDFEHWREVSDWQLCARLGYQIIERRGTGGGFFRKMYAHYLRQAEIEVNSLASAGMFQRMNDIADKWTTLSMLLKCISEESEPPSFAEASEALVRLADREEGFWNKVLEIVAD